MRAAERDFLLLLLAVTSGAADAWSYLGLGHAFVANMTGNTVLLGVSIFAKSYEARHTLIALASYALGVALGSFLTRRVIAKAVWSRAISLTLFLEALLLLAAEAMWIHIKSEPPRGLRNAMLGVVAFGIGMQSGAMLRLQIPGIVTTYISGTWTTLVSGLVRLGASREPPPSDRHGFEERLILQSAFLATYFLSAFATGWLFHFHPMAAGALAALPVLTAATYGAAHDRKGVGSP